MINLLDTNIFKNFNEAELTEVKRALLATEKNYKKGEYIFHEGDTVSNLGIILEGSITIERFDYLGNTNILGLNTAGQIFAESYATANHPLMVNVIANENCKILFLNLNALKKDTSNESWYPKLLMNLLLVSNNKNIELSKRNFHTFSKRTRGRIMSYLTSISIQKGSNEFDIPLNRQQMANYLNLDRSALSNELCKMRDEGILEFHKNHFRLYV